MLYTYYNQSENNDNNNNNIAGCACGATWQSKKTTMSPVAASPPRSMLQYSRV